MMMMMMMNEFPMNLNIIKINKGIKQDYELA